MRNALPVLSVVLALLAAWYLAVIPMNAQWERDQAGRGGYQLTTQDLIARTMAQDRPRLPAPHQVVAEIWRSTWVEETTGRQGLVRSGSLSNRGLLHHTRITLTATLLGFVIGTAAGIVLAVGIVYNRAMDASVMPWAIASQTIPIIALAPMIIVVLNSLGISGLIPKSIIAAYLSFFPVAVGMVKGLRAPDAMQLDQMKTWNATGLQSFLRLRLPASMPYFFASMKVAVAAALVGTIVGELPVQQGGLGVRLLSGSYYGQTVQIWAALFAAAALAAALVGIVGLIQGRVLKRMGMA